MYDDALVTAVGVAVLLAGVLLSLVIAERRRRELRQRLAALSSRAQGGAETGIAASARKVQPRSSGLLRALRGERLEGELAATGHRIRLLHLIALALAAFVAVFAFISFTLQYGPVPALAAGLAAAFGAPFLLLRWAQQNYQNRFLDVFPDAIDLIVRAVRAGLPALEAIEVAARETADPVGTELRQTMDETRIGVQLDEALQHTAQRVRVADFRFFVVSLALQRRSGGSLAETLTILSTVIRQRKIARQKARALTVETKLSSTVISVMPIIAGIGFWIINPDVVRLLFYDPRGRFMLGLSIITLITGLVTMNRIVKRTLR